MSEVDLVARLQVFPSFAKVPIEEIEWLTAHSQWDEGNTGAIIASKGEHIENLWIILSGHIAIRVDRGAGMRRVMEWRAGDIGGMLPYSRMTGPPGNAYFEEKTELLLIHEKHFPEMIRCCPIFTAQTVHVMLDRARTFNASELQDEKMISLGKLAAGLAHELNNPASALIRSANMLLENLLEADSAARHLGTLVRDDGVMDSIERTRAACLAASVESVRSPVEQSDREDAFAAWLKLHDADTDYASSLAETDVSIEMLGALANTIQDKNALNVAMRWIATGCSLRSLALDIKRAATRIHDLVATVKRFTFMDQLGGPDAVDVEAGLRDTVRMMASKAKSKGAAITMDIEPKLPHAYSNGGALNQVWMNLIDNALDAISANGRIHIKAFLEYDCVVVQLTDNGAGIPANIAPRIFDPFFTTKPPGQGTGLGLDIARRILRQYHGDISFISQPGHTEFTVRLLSDDSISKRTVAQLAAEKEGSTA